MNHSTSPEIAATQYAPTFPWNTSGSGSATTANNETNSGYDIHFRTARITLYCRVWKSARCVSMESSWPLSSPIVSSAASKGSKSCGARRTKVPMPSPRDVPSRKYSRMRPAIPPRATALARIAGCESPAC